MSIEKLIKATINIFLIIGITIVTVTFITKTGLSEINDSLGATVVILGILALDYRIFETLRFKL